jgi:hypothetical protein
MQPRFKIEKGPNGWRLTDRWQVSGFGDWRCGSWQIAVDVAAFLWGEGPPVPVRLIPARLPEPIRLGDPFLVGGHFSGVSGVSG